jgi:hypothetical protein
MVSPDEADKTYGEPTPCLKTLPDGTVSVWNTYSRGVFHLKSVQCMEESGSGRPVYPEPAEEPAVAGMGLAGIRHLTDLVKVHQCEHGRSVGRC